MLESLKAQDPTTRYAYEYTDQEMTNGECFTENLERVIVQTATMRRNYELYKDTMFMDATYSTNPYRMPLVVFSGVNNEGKNCILGYAIVKRETMETYTWLLQHLVNFNDGVAPKVLLTDFDPSMAGAIERAMPQTLHLLCQWHMMQNLKKNMIFLSKRHTGCAKMLYKFIVYELLFCEDPFKFQQVANVIFQNAAQLGTDKIRYLRSLLQIKEKWASAFTPDIFTAGTHATSRAESVNAQIKLRVTSQSRLTDIFDAMNDLTDKITDNSEAAQRNNSKLFLNHPLLADLYCLYTRHAFEIMLNESMLSHELRVLAYHKEQEEEEDEFSRRIPVIQTKIKNRMPEGKISVFDNKRNLTFTVSVNKITENATTLRQQIENPNLQVLGVRELQSLVCNCKFFWHNQYYCSHIFCVLNTCQVRTAADLKPLERWTKRYQWEKFKNEDLNLVPLSPANEHKLAEMEAKKLEELDEAGGDSEERGVNHAQLTDEKVDLIE